MSPSPEKSGKKRGEVGLVQIFLKPKEQEFTDQFNLSRPEVVRQALHLLMNLDKHRQGIKSGLLSGEVAVGLVLELLYPIDLDIARREEIVDSRSAE